MTTEKTSWKKNLDSRYISGEDLQESFNGLRPEMIVEIEKFEDTETFDQQKNSKVIKTGLFLKEVGGKSLYKPAILNKTNGRFLLKEFGSDALEDWIGKPVIMFSQKDSRHGYVVRFKKFVKPQLVKGSENFDKCVKAIASGFTIDQIKKRYIVSEEVEALLKTPATNG
jgi:hypothetical protein